MTEIESTTFQNDTLPAYEGENCATDRYNTTSGGSARAIDRSTKGRKK